MRNIHLIGIGGAGLSAIATVLLQQGDAVSGSDMQVSSATERLERLGARVFIGHRPENLSDGLDTVIISSAIPPDNPELVEAQRRGLPVSKRAAWLGKMMAGYLGIAVAGSHGKTTTTAMTAYLLQALGQNPTYIIGGVVPQLGTNAAAGQGRAFVIEADEYDYAFLGLRPTIGVVTTVEWDHPDMFPSVEAVQAAFIEFVRRVTPQGLVIGCGDEAGVRSVIEAATTRVLTYGFQPDNDWRAGNLQPNGRGGFDFSVWRGDEPLSRPVSLAVPGRHNVLNALAALIIVAECGLDVDQAALELGRFAGVGRRFELKAEVNGITIIDDYAHHPTEIRATLAAARARFGQRPLWVVTQPHTFSRALALLDDFAAAFGEADHVIIVDIFASREKDEGRVSSQDIVSRMEHPDARYIGPLREATGYLARHVTPGDVVLTFGAGDSDKVGEWLIEVLSDM